MNENEKINIEKKDDDKKKKRLIIIFIIIILILSLVIGLMACQLLDGDKPSKTAVIEQDTQEELNDVEETGQLRIKINPVVTVKNDTMQNLNFCNYNDERLLQCKIKVGEDYVYIGEKLKPSEILKGDFVDMKHLKTGENEALAEIYSFSLAGDAIGQTNVKMTLNVE